MQSGNLSGFNAGWGDEFLGGPYVKDLENTICKKFNVKHAITVNSWSSGLLIAVGSLGLEPGDEIIVSPWNMCSTVTSILQWLCVPVFCDIEPETFSIDPKKLESCITNRTRAVIVNDMHGRPCDFDSIKEIADRYNLKIISDSAQTIGSIYKGNYSGTLADIGGFSFNWHKHIHCGEGGVVVTNDDVLAKKMQLLRNHAEGVVSDSGLSIENMIGFNFRLTEIQAAIMIKQIKKLDDIIKIRQKNAQELINVLNNFSDYILLPTNDNRRSNVFCSFPIVFKNKEQINLWNSRLYQEINQGKTTSGIQIQFE
jgi:dTDP-4-amino-4,6-dideoxygalactose transaminase